MFDVLALVPAVGAKIAAATGTLLSLMASFAPAAVEIERAAAAQGPAGVMANVDLLDDWVVAPPAPVDGCEETLTAGGVTFAPARIPIHRNKGGAFLCGAEQVVRYTRGPGKIRWRSSPKVACGLALALAGFEAVIQEEALRHLGVKVAKIAHMGTYNCREMAAYPGWVSEHSYANALDIKTFVLTKGREVSVRGGWTARGTSKRAVADSAFLHAVAHRAFAEDHFSVVLTPAFDAAHRGHFHLDLARYRVDGTRPDTP